MYICLQWCRPFQCNIKTSKPFHWYATFPTCHFCYLLCRPNCSGLLYIFWCSEHLEFAVYEFFKMLEFCKKNFWVAGSNTCLMSALLSQLFTTLKVYCDNTSKWKNECMQCMSVWFWSFSKDLSNPNPVFVHRIQDHWYCFGFCTIFSMSWMSCHAKFKATKLSCPLTEH